MKKTSKQIISFLMVAIIMLTNLSFSAFAGPDFSYRASARPGYRLTNATYKCTDKEFPANEKLTYSYDKNGNLLSTPYSTYKYTYDKNGNVTSKTESDNESTKKTKYSYDKNGYITKETVSYKSLGDSYTYKKSYSYDKNYNITKIANEITSKGKTVKTVETYKYDKNGNILSIKGNYDEPKYTYDKNGNLTKKVFKDNSVSVTNTYTYDKKGNLTKETQKSQYGTYSITYKYDKNGNMIEMKEKLSGGDQQINTFDSKGRLIKEKTIWSKGGSNTSTHTYDKKGNRIKTVIKAGNKLSETITYTYDKNGNKIQEKSKNDSYEEIYTFKYKKVNVTEKESASSDEIMGSIFARPAISSFKYDGKAKTPNFVFNSIFGRDFQLKRNIDYKVTYKNNKKVGTAKAIITFIGTYKDCKPVEVTFKIVK